MFHWSLGQGSFSLLDLFLGLNCVCGTTGYPTLAHITWHHMTSHDLTWHHMTSHDITWPHMTPHNIAHHIKDDLRTGMCISSLVIPARWLGNTGLKTRRYPRHSVHSIPSPCRGVVTTDQLISFPVHVVSFPVHAVSFPVHTGNRDWQTHSKQLIVGIEALGFLSLSNYCCCSYTFLSQLNCIMLLCWFSLTDHLLFIMTYLLYTVV